MELDLTRQSLPSDSFKLRKRKMRAKHAGPLTSMFKSLDALLMLKGGFRGG